MPLFEQGQTLIVLCRDEVAPRFDLAAEALITAPGARAEARRHMLLAHASSEDLCDLITSSNISTVVCGGIEEDYYHYLRWKHVEVICDVMGGLEDVLASLAAGNLKPGDRFFQPGA